MEKIKLREEDFTDVPAQTFIRLVNCQKDGCKGHYRWNRDQKTVYAGDEISIPHLCDICNHEVYLEEAYPTTVSKVITPESVEVEGVKEWDVWMEGYSATGQHSPAQFLGTYKATTFREACLAHRDTMREPEYFNETDLSIWGCKMFDNEEDARKAFG